MGSTTQRGRPRQTAWLVAALPLLAPQHWGQACDKARRSFSNAEKSIRKAQSIG